MKKIFTILIIFSVVLLVGCNVNTARVLRKELAEQEWVEKETGFETTFENGGEMYFDIYESIVEYEIEYYDTESWVFFYFDWDLTTGELEIWKQGNNGSETFRLRKIWNFFESEECLLELVEGCYPEDFLYPYDKVKSVLDESGLSFEDFLVPEDELITEN